jgi:hypothetical protein
MKETDYKESTDSANIPDVPSMPAGPCGKMPCGTPYFKATDDQFWSLHTKSRQNGQWFNKHYGDTNIGQWAKANKDKPFYLKHESGIFRKVKAQ